MEDMKNKKLKVDNLTPNTWCYYTGYLEYGRYTTRLCEGKELSEYIEQQKKFNRPASCIMSVPHSRFTLSNASITKTGTELTLTEKFGSQKIYTNKSGVNILNCEKKNYIPLFYKRRSDGQLDRIPREEIEGAFLENDQLITVAYKVYETKTGMKGFGLEYIVFEEGEPKFWIPEKSSAPVPSKTEAESNIDSNSEMGSNNDDGFNPASLEDDCPFD